MKAISLDAPKNFRRIEVDAPAPPAGRRGAGARPSRRHLRHRHRRLPRQDAVLQLSAHSRPRTRRRGGRRRRRASRTSSPATAAPSSRISTARNATPAAAATPIAARSTRRSASTATAGCGRASSCRPASCTSRASSASSNSPWSRRWPSAATPSIAPHYRRDETCLIIGAGPIGLATLEFAKLTGAKIIVLGHERPAARFLPPRRWAVEHTLQPSRQARTRACAT